MNTTINNINLVEFFEAEDTSTIGYFLYCGDAQVACGCINRSDVRELLAMNTDPCGLFPITDISLLLMLDRIDLEPDERTEE
tara:strand:+ start:2722 stop:2967 length:246 start_codon:yes stop_codon:yes gene_type:complete